MTRVSLYAGVLLALLSGVAGAQSDEAAKSWWPRYMADSRNVSLPDGRTLSLYCQGRGTPVVVMDGGLGGGAHAWRKVQGAIARTTRACVYDRAGYWKSPPTMAARDAGTEADDLAALLKAARLPAPYILVAHSYGAYIARLYAGRHTGALAGLVLVEPASEYQLKRLREVVPAVAAVAAGELAQFKSCAADPRPPEMEARCIVRPAPPDLPPEFLGWFNASETPAFAGTLMREQDAMETVSAPQLVAERKSLGRIPMILLTRGTPLLNPTPGITAEQIANLDKMWRQMHQETLAISSASEIRVVEGAGHAVATEKPDAVITAVADVLAKARASRH